MGRWTIKKAAMHFWECPQQWPVWKPTSSRDPNRRDLDWKDAVCQTCQLDGLEQRAIEVNENEKYNERALRSGCTVTMNRAGINANVTGGIFNLQKLCTRKRLEEF